MARKPVTIQRSDWPVELAVGAVLVAVFGIMVGAALTYAVDARLFPLIVGTAGLVLSLMVFGRSVYLYSQSKKSTAPLTTKGPAPAADAGERRKKWISLCSAPAFGALLWLVGFYIASGVVLTLMPYGLGYKKAGRILLLMAATVVGMRILFADIMGIRMPPGLLGDWFLETFVYTD